MKKVVFTFGRMNPITNGHGKLVRKVQSVAKANRADPHVYLSHTQDSKKNPLNYKTKLSYAKSAFGNVVKQSNDKTVIDILKSLQKKYSDVVMVVGSDRVNEFKKLLDKYNGKDFKFDTVDVVSSGDRDPDAEGVAGMSASKLRDLASKNDYREFKMGLPNLREPKMKQIFKDVRKGMQLEELQNELDLITDEELAIFVETLSDEELDKEYLEERKPLTIMQRIKRGRMMKRLAPRFKRLRKIKKFRVAPLQRLQFRAKQAAKKMFRKRLAGKKGEKYASLPTSQKIAIDKMIAKRSDMIAKFAKRMLPVVRKKEMERIRQARKSSTKRESVEVDTSYLEYIAELRKTPQDKDIKDKKGTQPAKYHKGLKPTTKAARDSHFKKYGDMPDNDPSAYKPAPGDSKGKTKLSKHTKKYHKMFPEKQDWVDRAFNAVFRMTHPKAYKLALDMYKKMLEKGEKNPVRKVAMAIKGIDPRDFQDYLDNLVSKGKLARVLANGYLPEAVTPTPKMDVKVPQVHYNTHAAAHKAEKKYPYQAALTDLDLNTKNRNETIKEYAYGPANPDAEEEAEEFWQQKADLWGTSVDMVKTMRCANCNAFDQKPETMKIMVGALGPEGEKIVKGSNLGFCEFFEFKCAGSRVCDAWVGGGPLKEEPEYSYLNYSFYPKIRNKLFEDLKYIDEISFFDNFSNIRMSSTLPYQMLSASDHSSMQHSLEIRSPYLNRKLLMKLLEFEHETILGQTYKFLQKHILAEYLPKRLINQKKIGFILNPKIFFRNSKKIENEFDNEKFKFDRLKLRELIYEEFFKNESKHNI